MSDFNARYTLFPVQEKKSSKSPDVTGNIELLAEEIPNLIAYLQSAERVEDYKGNQIVKIRMSGWDNESKTGKQYQSGMVSPPQEQNEQRQPVAAGGSQSWNTPPLQPTTEEIPF